MPEHIAVQCFQCNVFQVVQRCKPTGAQRVSKWECRMCRAKQTVLRVFGQGMQAAPLRPLVQELNMNRGRAADVAAAAPAREPEPAPQPVFVRFDEEWDALLSGSSSQDEDGDDNDALLRPPTRGRAGQPRTRPAKRRAVAPSATASTATTSASASSSSAVAHPQDDDVFAPKRVRADSRPPVSVPKAAAASAADDDCDDDGLMMRRADERLEVVADEVWAEPDDE